MTTRDRLVLIAVIVLVVLAGGWLMVVKPERKKAAQLESQVTTARGELSGAQGQLEQAKSAQARYTEAYGSIVSLGKAVPADREVPSLVYELQRVSQDKHVEFESIASSTSTSASAGSTTATTAGFAQLPFTFTFSGSFNDLAQLLGHLDGFTERSASGQVTVSGRLLTIQSVSLTPTTSSTAGGATKTDLSGSITATAYVLPVGETLTSGATAAGPVGATAQPGSSASSTSTPATPAVVEAKP